MANEIQINQVVSYDVNAFDQGGERRVLILMDVETGTEGKLAVVGLPLEKTDVNALIAKLKDMRDRVWPKENSDADDEDRDHQPIDSSKVGGKTRTCFGADVSSDPEGERVRPAAGPGPDQG